MRVLDQLTLGQSSLADSCALFFLPLSCHKEKTSLAKRICSLQTCFAKRERWFLAKLLKMGVIWSSYKEKRKEKKEFKRFVNTFVVFISWENEKKKNRTCFIRRRKGKLN